MNERKNLALAHRIIAKLKMDDLTYTHLSTRIKGGRFLLSPFGIQFGDVRPRDLLEWSLDGGFMIEKGLCRIGLKNPRTFNKTGFAIHSSIYKARKEVGAVIHLHTKETIAVSVHKEGLLPLSQHALHFYDRVSYHSYNSLILTPQEEEAQFIRDLGQNKVMFLQNHGFVTMGATVWEALFYAYHLQKACEVQVLVHDLKNAIIPSVEVCIKARNELLSFEKDLGRRDFESYGSLK